MIHIVCALHAEARPLIRHFKLRKIGQTGPLSCYGNADIRLVVSGVGPVRAAVAATYTICTCDDASRSHVQNQNRRSRVNHSSDVLMNIGICGLNTNRIAPGEPVFIHKIIDTMTKRTYYPDPLVRHSLQEGTLATFPHPADQQTEVPAELADMEGAAFYEAASAFVGPHQIALVKVASDRLQPESVTARLIDEQIEGALPALETVIQSYSLGPCPDGPILTPDEVHQLQQLIERWKLSVTSGHQLMRAAKHFRIRTGLPLPDLSSWQSLTVQHKREGKKYAEQLRQSWLHS